jgi:hypothetical protein
MGGSFGAGFLAGSVGSYFGSSGKSSKANEMIGNTAIEAVIGGTISMYQKSSLIRGEAFSESFPKRRGPLYIDFRNCVV